MPRFNGIGKKRKRHLFYNHRHPRRLTPVNTRQPITVSSVRSSAVNDTVETNSVPAVNNQTVPNDESRQSLEDVVDGSNEEMSIPPPAKEVLLTLPLIL